MGRQGWGIAASIGLGLFGGWAFGALATAWGVGGTAAQMMVGLGYMGGSFLGNLLFADDSDVDMPEVARYPIQKTTMGVPVPIIYGKVRTAGNVVWMSDATTYEVELGGGGGKGGGGGDGPTQTMYRRSFLILICEGERTISKIWANNEEITSGITYSYALQDYGTQRITIIPTDWRNNLSKQEITVFSGDGVNEGLSELVGEDFAHYKYDCCVFFANYDLGASDSLPNFVFEVTQVPNLIIGSEWTEIGELPAPAYNMIDLGDGVVLAAAGYAIYRSTDAGVTWTEVQSASAVQCLFDCGSFIGMGGIVYHSIIAGCYTGDVLRSGDGGITWTTYTTLPQGVYRITAIAGGTEASQDALLQTSTRLYRVTNYGAGYLLLYTWNVPSNPPTDVAPRSYVYCGDEIIIMAAISAFPGISGNYSILIYKSENEGSTFSYVTTIPDSDASPYTYSYFPMEYLGSGVIIAATTYGKVFRSTDYGETWTTVADLGINGLEMSFLGYSTLLIVGENDDGVYQSIDNGATWAQLGTMDGIYGAESILWLQSESAVLVGTGNDGKVFQGQNVSYDAGLEDDWNAAVMVRDLLTNTRYGTGMPEAYLNLTSFTVARDYWNDTGLLISLVIDRQRPVLDWITYILAHVSGFMYRQGNQFYLGVWRNELPAGEIGRNDLAVDEDGGSVPVQVAKRKYSETYNYVEIEWSNREDDYSVGIAKATDDVDIRVSGSIRKKTVELAGIKKASVAELMKWRLLIDSMYRFSTYTFRLGPKHQDIKAGRVYTLSDGFKVDNARVRITKLIESQRANEIECEAIDDVSELYPDLTAWDTTGVNQRTPDVVVTIDDLAQVETAYREDWEQKVIMLSFAPQSIYTLGVMLFVSRDDVTYEFVQRISFPTLTAGEANVAGTTLTSLPAARAVTWRGDESLLVDVGTVGDLATDITDQQFFGNQKLAKIGDEIVAYKTCEETETEGQWRITGLIRGLYQTDPVAHEAGETFATLLVNFSYIYQDSDISSTLYFKAMPFFRNIALALEDLDAAIVPVKGHVQRPFGVALVRLTSDENDPDAGQQQYSGATFDAYWNLCSKTAGFNVGGMDGGGTWFWGDDESELVAQGGVPYGAYTADPDIETIDLVFRQEDGTLIGQRNIPVASSETITKATDLGGNNPAEIEIWPRYSLRAIREESILADDGS